MTLHSELAPIQYTELIIFILTRTRRPPNNRAEVDLVRMNKEESLIKKTCLSGEFNQKDMFNADAVISLVTGSKKGGLSESKRRIGNILRNSANMKGVPLKFSRSKIFFIFFLKCKKMTHGLL